MEKRIKKKRCNGICLVTNTLNAFDYIMINHMTLVDVIIQFRFFLLLEVLHSK